MKNILTFFFVVQLILNYVCAQNSIEILKNTENAYASCEFYSNNGEFTQTLIQNSGNKLIRKGTFSTRFSRESGKFNFELKDSATLGHKIVSKNISIKRNSYKDKTDYIFFGNERLLASDKTSLNTAVGRVAGITYGLSSLIGRALLKDEVAGGGTLFIYDSISRIEDEKFNGKYCYKLKYLKKVIRNEKDDELALKPFKMSSDRALSKVIHHERVVFIQKDNFFISKIEEFDQFDNFHVQTVKVFHHN